MGRAVITTGLLCALLLVQGCADSGANGRPLSPGIAPGAVGSPSSRPSAKTEELAALARRAFSGSDLDDMISLLQNAEKAADEEQRYQAYLGTWQLMRRAYHQQGRTVEQKAALDAVEAVARPYRFYSKDAFKIDK